VAFVAAGVVTVAAETHFALARVLTLKDHGDTTRALAKRTTDATRSACWQLGAARWRALCSPRPDGEMAQEARTALGVQRARLANGFAAADNTIERLRRRHRERIALLVERAALLSVGAVDGFGNKRARSGADATARRRRASCTVLTCTVSAVAVFRSRAHGIAANIGWG